MATLRNNVKEKDPNAVRVYPINWAGWLNGDTIAASIWIVPTGVSAVSDSFTPTTSAIKLSGGTAGVEYRVTNRITTTNSGEIEDGTLVIKVMEQ